MKLTLGEVRQRPPVWLDDGHSPFAFPVTYAAPEAPCKRCPHQFRHHAVTADGYRCRGCNCKRSHWR